MLTCLPSSFAFRTLEAKVVVLPEQPLPPIPPFHLACPPSIIRSASAAEGFLCSGEVETHQHWVCCSTSARPVVIDNILKACMLRQPSSSLIWCYTAESPWCIETAPTLYIHTPCFACLNALSTTVWILRLHSLHCREQWSTEARRGSREVEACYFDTAGSQFDPSPNLVVPQAPNGTRVHGDGDGVVVGSENIHL